MKFSDEQNAIINAKLDNNLVSASAGSGKTTVLTARIGDEVMSIITIHWSRKLRTI